MPTPNLFAYDPIGSVLVVIDEREVLVHRGADEAPKWKRRADGDLVGLGAGGDTVITLENKGKLTFFGGADGAVIEAVELGKEALSLAVTRNGSKCAVVVTDAVSIVCRETAPVEIAAAGATAAAWSRDGARLAVGHASGTVRIFSAAGEEVGATRLEEPVTSLCFSPAGFWLATGGDRVFRVAEDGSSVEQITRAGGMKPDCVCASTDGSMLAVRLSDTVMIALALPSRETVVQLSYMERTIAGVAFGPDRLLGVGLVGGDGNIVDVQEKQLRRTDTFEGRAHNRWLVSTVIKPEVLPEPPARAPIGVRDITAADLGPMPFSIAGLSILGWLGILGGLLALALALNMCR
ncbi:MAG: WD40 repeat domain-containing protein [Byssovorax sp.]